MTKLYIDKDVNILTGEEADKALSNENDASYVSDGKGIVRVPIERWETAQYAEKVHWMKRGIGAIEDRNFYHETGFDDYKAIKGRRFANAIELGCGPFTNLRIIGTKCLIEKCSLLDPLIMEYLTHPNCAYDGKKLLLARHFSKKTLLNMALGKYFTGFYNALRKRVNPTIAIKELLPFPVEQMPVDQKYDLVCIINVIEHCYDINLVFKNLISVMEQGAVFIFHDRYYSHHEVLDTVQTQYDAAHPLKVDRMLIDAFLTENFDPMYKKVTCNNSLAEGADEDAYEEIYFIGKRH